MTVEPIVPPATIGMLGGGQLGRYALMSAVAMGYRTLVVDPDPSAPAGVVAHEHLVAAYDDAATIERLARDCVVVTTEFENPPAATLEALEGLTRVAPNSQAVSIAQDRVAEKRFLAENGFPVAPFGVLLPDGDGAAPTDGGAARTPSSSPHEVAATPERFVLGSGGGAGSDAAVSALVDGGAIVKTARLGYDGKGQRNVESSSQMHAAWAELGGVTCVVERRLPLVAEVSALVARTADGHSVTWPVAENVHVGGILDVSVVPARVDVELADRAVGLAMAIADALRFVGVLAVEFFVVDRDGTEELIVNELAPRPHNSGHWTIDAAVTSQFQQQVRAVCGVGLGPTAMTAPAVAMVNLLGDLWFDHSGARREPVWANALAHPAASLHLYGKSEPRTGRKMGHLTVTAETPDLAERAALDLRSRLSAP